MKNNRFWDGFCWGLIVAGFMVLTIYMSLRVLENLIWLMPIKEIYEIPLKQIQLNILLWY